MPCWVCRGDRHRERDITRRRRRWWRRRRRKRRTFTTRSRRGGGSPTRGTYTRFARRIASKNICRRESREEKKIRGRIRHARGTTEKEGRARRRVLVPGGFNLAIGMRRYATRRDATRRRASILERFRASEGATERLYFWTIVPSFATTAIRRYRRLPSRETLLFSILTQRYAFIPLFSCVLVRERSGTRHYSRAAIAP